MKEIGKNKRHGDVFKWENYLKTCGTLSFNVHHNWDLEGKKRLVFDILIYLERFLLPGLTCTPPRARPEAVDSHKQSKNWLFYCCPNLALVMPWTVCSHTAPVQGARQPQEGGR